MNHFFLNEENFNQGKVRFPADITHQILHVLRLEAGDEVYVLNNRGNAYHVRLVVEVDAGHLLGEIVSSGEVESEPAVKIGLCFALTNRDKVELILQKATEVGVSAFYPFISERCLVQTTDLPMKKFTRWERIIREAAEQSGRGLLPKLHKPMKLEDCAQSLSVEYKQILAAWEEAERSSENRLREVLNGSCDRLALFVGPEGGFSHEEIETIQRYGGEVVSLGKRILRMETAAIVFPALVLQILGEL